LGALKVDSRLPPVSGRLLAVGRGAFAISGRPLSVGGGLDASRLARSENALYGRAVAFI
jgi:hypothetical protein